MRQCAQAKLAIDLPEQPEREAIAGRDQAIVRAKLGCRLIDNVVASRIEGRAAAEPVGAVTVTRCCKPLDTEFRRFFCRHFNDQRLYVHLRAPRIKLVNYGTQVTVHRFAGRDNQRIRGGIGLDKATGAARRQSRRLRCGQRWRRRACAALLLLRGCSARTALLRRSSLAGAGIGGDHGAQGLRELDGISIAQVHDMHITRYGRGRIELPDQGFRQVGARRRRRAHDHGIRARIGQQGNPACVSASHAGLRFQQTVDHHGEVAGNRMLDRNDIEVARCR